MILVTTGSPITRVGYDSTTTHRGRSLLNTVIVTLLLLTVAKSITYEQSKTTNKMVFKGIELSNSKKVTKCDPSLKKDYSWEDKDTYIWALLLTNKTRTVSIITKQELPSNSITLALLMGLKDTIDRETTGDELLKKLKDKELALVSSGKNTNTLNLREKRKTQTELKFIFAIFDMTIDQDRLKEGFEIDNKSFTIKETKITLFTSLLNITFNDTEESFNLDVETEGIFAELFEFERMWKIEDDDISKILKIVGEADSSMPYIVGFFAVGILVAVIVYWKMTKNKSK